MRRAWRFVFVAAIAVLLGVRLTAMALLNAGAVIVEQKAMANWQRGPAACYVVPATHIETAAPSLLRRATAFGASSSRVAGFSDLLAGRDSDAIAAFDASGDTTSLFRSGDIVMRRGDRAGALQRWIHATPTALMRIQLAKVLSDQVNDGIQNDDRFDDAARVATTAIDISRGRHRVEALWLAVNSFQGEGKAAIAAQLLSRPETDRDPSLMALRAYGAFVNGDDAAALSSANRSLSLGAVWMAHYIRGVIEMRECRTGDAMRDFEAGIALPSGGDYRQAWIHRPLGAVRWLAGDRVHAIREWETFAALQPGDPTIGTLLQQARSGTLAVDCRTFR